MTSKLLIANASLDSLNDFVARHRRSPGKSRGKMVPIPELKHVSTVSSSDKIVLSSESEFENDGTTELPNHGYVIQQLHLYRFDACTQCSRINPSAADRL